MTEFNNVCRKPFWPREKSIRWLLVALDVKLPPKKKRKAKVPIEESSESSHQEESESESSTQDEEVDPAEKTDTCFLTN